MLKNGGSWGWLGVWGGCGDGFVGVEGWGWGRRYGGGRGNEGVGGGDRVLNSVKSNGGRLWVCGKCVFLQNEIRGVAGVAGSPLQPEEVWNLPIF